MSLRSRYPVALIVMSILLLTACGGAPPAPDTAPATTSAVPVPTTASPPASSTSAADSRQAERAALEFLRSPERESWYGTNVPKAGILIAQALEAGHFGPVFRYDDAKIALQPGYVGWGGFASNDDRHFAWVYWQADGSIDYTKPITQIASTHVSGDPSSEVTMFGPANDTAQEIGSYWRSYLGVPGGIKLTTDHFDIEFPSLAANSQPGMDPYQSPTTLDELKGIDQRAMERLMTNMASHFGPDWNA